MDWVNGDLVPVQSKPASACTSRKPGTPSPIRGVQWHIVLLDKRCPMEYNKVCKR